MCGFSPHETKSKTIERPRSVSERERETQRGRSRERETRRQREVERERGGGARERDLISCYISFQLFRNETKFLKKRG